MYMYIHSFRFPSPQTIPFRRNLTESSCPWCHRPIRNICCIRYFIHSFKILFTQVLISRLYLVLSFDIPPPPSAKVNKGISGNKENIDFIENSCFKNDIQYYYRFFGGKERIRTWGKSEKLLYIYHS